jgi:hypothetical protein
LNQHRVQSTCNGRFGRETQAVAGPTRRGMKWNRIMAATLIGFTGICTRAQSPEERLLPALWDAVYTVRGGGGYKDNVFLAHDQPQAAGFLSGGADVMVLRIAPTGPQFNFFASGDVNHFFATTPSYNEYTAFAQAQVEQNFSDTLKGSLAGEYFYQDQFLDVSNLDPTAGDTNMAVRGSTITARPALRLDLPRQFWLALESPVTRQFFNQPLDDYWRVGGKLTLGRAYGHKSYLSLGYEPGWRWYDSEAALTSSGEPIPGTHRERFEQEVVFAWRHFWDEPGRWRTTTKVGSRLTDENGGGYANYTAYFGSTQILYRAGPWEISAESKLRYYDYHTETVSDTDNSKLQRSELDISFRVERELGKHLRVIAAYDREETWSNDDLEAYTVNTVSGSLQWEF